MGEVYTIRNTDFIRNALINNEFILNFIIYVHYLCSANLDLSRISSSMFSTTTALQGQFSVRNHHERHYQDDDGSKNRPSEPV